MTRLIKRYGSRKLYDTKESRYVSLEDLASWVRDGHEVQVIDNATAEDVTVPTLTQVISEEGRKGSSVLPSELLHDLIRMGGSAVGERVRRFQDGVDRFFKKSIDRLVPVSNVRDEMNQLRHRLDELEAALAASETEQNPVTEEKPKRKAPTATAAKRKPRTTSTKKSTATKSAASKAPASKAAAAKAKTTSPRTTKASAVKPKATANKPAAKTAANSDS